MHGSIRHASLATRLGCLAIALVLAACGGGSASSIPVASAQATPSTAMSPASTGQPASATATAEPTPPASPTAFTSATYDYSASVPAGWTTIQATALWDGSFSPAHDAPVTDQFVGPALASAWAMVAPTDRDLAEEVQNTIAAITADHSDTCPPVPESQDPIEIGGEPGVLLNYDCGILISMGIAVHDGDAYVFGFRDPAVRAATDPADRATFLELMDSVTFPD